jgi:KDO2-lipid IV(A) lauroyltransferase
VLASIRRAVRTESTFWRKALSAGVHFGPDPWLRYSPPFFGWMFGAALRGPRETVRKTLRRVLGPRPAAEELRSVAAVFATFASSMTDAMVVGSGRGYNVTTRPVGDWYFLSSLALGRGLILATANTAGWDIAGPATANVRPGQVMVVMHREDNGDARALHDALRRRAGVEVCHVGDDPLDALPVLKHLRRGGIVALKYDRTPRHMRARPVTFLGEPWRVAEGPLKLAALSGAPLLPVFTRRLGFLDYQLVNTPPLELPRRPSEQDLDGAAQVLADRLEQFVRSHPTQWFRFADD